MIGFEISPVVCVSWLEVREGLHIGIYRSVRAVVANLKDECNKTSGGAVPDTWSEYAAQTHPKRYIITSHGTRPMNV